MNLFLFYRFIGLFHLGLSHFDDKLQDTQPYKTNKAGRRSRTPALLGMQHVQHPGMDARRRSDHRLGRGNVIRLAADIGHTSARLFAD